ncbi:hypothetical protein CANMA_004135 [Candida margitis]|uniref:uncharacterized protein n=1 Tax=Candida margitis TaxID=1775924 RepID=UPI002226BF7A|nr:uncharacterized protein CANMA_004135 [Candida margitis]KAI5959117.1 hypothetical protein CANMA_004135 [Candida margitis]
MIGCCRIKSNDSTTTAATTFTSSWSKSSIQKIIPADQSLNELQQQRQQQYNRATTTEQIGSIEATFDLDETSSTVSSTPSPILSNIPQTSYDAFITSAKTRHTHNYTIDEEDVTYITSLNYNYMYEKDAEAEDSGKFGYTFDYVCGQQGDEEADSFVNERESETGERQLELLRNLS